MSAHDADIQKQVRGYKIIFGLLALFTALTVAVSHFHLPLALAIIVALAIASVKGTLVAGWFMHLRAERKAIYGLLAVTVAFFVFLLLWPLFDIGGGMGKHSVMNGVKPAWDPKTAHHADGAKEAESGTEHGH